ncbi:MAG: S26 family signal peptidase [Treponema sp.]|jgi:signal peptidase I|nr:S26 family signal peptidase [Treponema sp.]
MERTELCGEGAFGTGEREKGCAESKRLPARPRIKAVAGALALALMMKLFLFDFMIAEGPSMMPAISTGKALLVCKLAYGLRFPGSGHYLLRWAYPAEGDIVVFYTPLGEIAVKRCGEIIGGDFIALGDNSLQSYDSRSYGPVSVDNIIGRVLGIK